MSDGRAADLRSLLATRGLLAAVSWVEATGSTNDDAKAYAAAGGDVPAIFVADEQTRGRGRSGNAWRSARGEGLLLSIVSRPALAPESSAPITLAVGAALAGVVDELAPGRVKLKWPNDVELDGKKLAGILVEAQTRGDHVSALIVGAGLNVAATELAPEIATTATSLALGGVDVRDRVELAARVVLAIHEAVIAFAGAGLAPFLARIRALDALAGASISVAGVHGVAAGIDDVGRLLVAAPDGTATPVAAGHVERARSST